MNFNPFHKNKLKKRDDNMLGIGDIVAFTFRKDKTVSGEIIDYSYATRLYTVKTDNAVEYKLNREQLNRIK